MALAHPHSNITGGVGLTAVKIREKGNRLFRPNSLANWSLAKQLVGETTAIREKYWIPKQQKVVAAAIDLSYITNHSANKKFAT